jgi:hypothetical protein
MAQRPLPVSAAAAAMRHLRAGAVLVSEAAPASVLPASVRRAAFQAPPAGGCYAGAIPDAAAHTSQLDSAHHDDTQRHANARRAARISILRSCTGT